MELALHVANITISAVAIVLALRKHTDAKNNTLRRIVGDAVAYAGATKHDGIPTERVALQAAILADLKDNGKRDFTDGQLLVSIRAALHR